MREKTGFQEPADGPLPIALPRILGLSPEHQDTGGLP